MTNVSAQNSQALRADLLPWFDAWRACAQNVLSQISGESQSFELSTEPFHAAASDLRYTVAAAGAIQGEMALRLSVSSGILLAHKLLGEIAAPADPAAAGGPPETVAKISNEISNDDRDALDELLRQILGLAATALSAAAGGSVQLQLARVEAPWAWAADAVATLRTREEAGVEIALEIGLSPALAVAFASRSSAAAETASPPAPAAVSEPVAISQSVALPANAAGYHRLLDVGLGVKLRFGTRRMLLRDVLALSSGMVVELENQLNSPVDLLLDGRIIARGEVVVIDGKYGLRVTDVVDSAPVRAAKPA
ncbi:MAG: flagellar motor switch protein FliN [Terriglobales bacterium]